MSINTETTGNPFTQAPEVTKIPGTLNVLTILTFIGCGISLLSSIYTFLTAKTSYDTIEKMNAEGTLDQLPSFMKSMAGPAALEILRKSYENRIPILIITLVSIALCVYGAIEMRKLHKQGFYMWLLGELLPIIGAVIFIGVGVFSGFGLIGLLIPAAFIIMYATQLKHLK